ncbi:MAG: hypothetical protein EZS28_011648 [Streblomastix strix]|uniref:Uncharacterized protein n=1 Tax=Streblomastix strix TaxID=222440 RepID=A0A5J4WD73_9EUKA|nr:MAG: hypothetical protein EZS28_011648 [Streblomastix strix]
MHLNVESIAFVKKNGQCLVPTVVALYEQSLLLKQNARFGIELDETESETEREFSESDSIAPQDPETKTMIQKLAPRPLKSEKQNRQAAVRLVEARIHQKAKNYDVFDPDLDEEHIRALRQNSRQDLMPLVFTDPPRMVDGERNPHIGNVLRNLIAAQRSNIVAIQSQFLIGKEEATERMLDTLDLIGQATADAQQI